MKELDWANLPFGYMKTDYNVRIYYRNEQWGELEVCSEETIPMHMAATCLHYGQEAFEGLKAFRGKDGKVRIFRLEENAAIWVYGIPKRQCCRNLLCAGKGIQCKSRQICRAGCYCRSHREAV